MKSLRTCLRNFWVYSGLIFLGGIMGLFALEIGFRIFSRQSGPLYQYSPIYGWEHIPNKVGYWTEETQKPVLIKINSKKLRDRELSYAKKDGVFRILILGDSFTEAFQVPLEYTASKVLESLLNSRQKIGVFEVINTGVGAYGTGQEFLFLKHEGVKYNPDLVMVNFFVNDVIDNVHPYNGTRPLFYIKNGKLDLYLPQPYSSSKFFRIVKEEILAHSYFAFWVNGQIRKLVLNYRGNNHTHDGYDEYIVVAGVKHLDINSHKFREGIEITKLLLSEISDSSARIGAKTVVFLIPSPFQLMEYYPQNMNVATKKDILRKSKKNDNRIFKEISAYLEKKGALYINPLEEFRTHAAQQKVLYSDLPGHWTIEGNRLAAEIMYNYLIKNQLIYAKRTN